MRRSWRFLPVAALALATACDSGLGNDETRLTILLTDAPGDFQAAVVTISSIYLQGSSDADPPTGRVVLMDTPVTTDLLTLSNDVATLVGGAVVPAGTYGQLRFVISGAYVEVETATGTKVYSTPGYDQAPAQVDGELKCPSCGQSGLKVSMQGGLKLESESQTLLVDFDVSESFGHEAGNSGKWIMRPSLKAANVQAAASLAVSVGLGGGVTLPVLNSQVMTLGSFSAELRGAAAEAGVPGESLALADPDGDGTFTARFTNVLPGSYTLQLKGPAGVTFATSPVMPLALTIGSGASATRSLSVVSAAAAN